MMERKRDRTSRLEIPIPVKPRPYRPGDGPALAPLSLTLENDSDAFIIDRHVRPGAPIGGEMKLEMYYVVGWPDLPAARVCILATRILDYVSPRTLEDWEYNYSLQQDKQREEEEAAAAAKARRRVEKAAKAKVLDTPSTNTPNSGALSVLGKKKRGRPSKADRSARELAQQTSFGGISNAEIPLPPASKSGPSLSTPKKKRLEAETITDAEDKEEEEVGDAIYKQLCGGDSEMDIDDPNEADEIGPRRFEQTLNHAPTASIAKYAHPFMLRPSPPRDRQQDEQKNDSLARKASTTPVPVPAYPRPRQNPQKQTSSSPRPKLITSNAVPVIPSTSPNKSTVRETPVPLPANPWSKPDQSSTSPKRNTTPGAAPAYPPILDQNGSKPTPHTPSTLLYYGFTPAGRSSGKWPSVTQTPASGDPTPRNSHTGFNHDADADAAAGGTPARSHKKKKKSKPASVAPNEEGENGADQEPVYAVKRLEGDQVMEVEGRAERFFKVRWEGDWPADQNPTWEPEENLPAALVRKYLKHKNKSKNRHKTGSGATESPPKRPMLKRKYSSVAEAFEGGEDEEEHALRRGGGPVRDWWAGGNGINENEQGGHDNDDDDNDDDGEERLLVTEQRNHPGTPVDKTQFDLVLAREIEASFRRGGGGDGGSGIRSSSFGS
ncbi:hypothetical protein F4809DRAFT_592743 [Biscogniauxia mediterranea]|nr:hypothetical protein F4809DRAFT_592743 [Biscogniauxia mediterranea]